VWRCCECGFLCCLLFIPLTFSLTKYPFVLFLRVLVLWRWRSLPEFRRSSAVSEHVAVHTAFSPGEPHSSGPESHRSTVPCIHYLNVSLFSGGLFLLRGFPLQIPQCLGRFPLPPTNPRSAEQHPCCPQFPWVFRGLSVTAFSDLSLSSMQTALLSTSIQVLIWTHPALLCYFQWI